MVWMLVPERVTRPSLITARAPVRVREVPIEAYSTTEPSLAMRTVMV